MNTRRPNAELLTQTTRTRSPNKHANHDRGPSLDPGDLTPPSSGSQREAKVPHMLMSPPPEETLRVSRTRPVFSPEKRGSSRHLKDPDLTSPSRTTKRKRNHTATASSASHTAHNGEGAVASTSRVTLEATPNPKPRKQHKRHTSIAEGPTTPTKSPSRPSASPSKRLLLRSPHADNPHADYLPPLPSFDREHVTPHRRSQTPLPLYEPPPERFTPPREILYTPVTAVSKSSKRKTAPPRSQQKGRRLTIQIKKEPPSIDLNAPPPPPSPSDDPLLLYGPKRRSRAPRMSMSSVRSRDTPPMSSSPVHALHEDDAPIAQIDFDAMDVDTDEEESVLPVFNLANNVINVDASWTDDDEHDEQFDHTGEYTGRFTMLKVPTKMDPPSSATKQRMDTWGRPISPFPLSKKPSNGVARPYSPIPESPTRVEEVPDLPVADEEELAALDDQLVPDSPSPQPTTPLFSHHDYDYPVEEAISPRNPSPTIPVSPPDIRGQTSAFEHRIDIQDDQEGPVEEPIIAVDGHSHIPIADDGSDDLEYEDYIPPEVVRHELANEASPQVRLARSHIPEQNEAPLEVVRQPIISPLTSGLSTEMNPRSLVTQFDTGKQLSPPRTDVIEPHLPASLPLSAPFSVPQGRDDTSATDPADTPTTPLRPGQSLIELSDAAKPVVQETPTHIEWSFSVPVNTGDQDEEDVLQEEEDAFSVIRELSKAPEEVPEDAPRAPLLRTPHAFDSPQNPFQSQARSTQSYVESNQALPTRLQTLPDPSFCLPDDDDDEVELSQFDPGVVKITSNDPMAAARAAAILRLHKYDCIENMASPQGRSASNVSSFIKNSRRRSLLQSGITRGKGSPSVSSRVLASGDINLPDLLREAEATILLEEGHLHGLSPANPKPAAPRNAFKTPARSVSTPWGPRIRRSADLPASVSNGPRDWAKHDWKKLDSCFTDERLALGGKLGSDSLASAEGVDLENVVNRFIEAMGGVGVVGQLGPDWERDNLLRRARALRRKQSGGKAAPPSPRTSTAYADSSWTPAQQYSTLLSPNATVLGNRLEFATPRPAPNDMQEMEVKYTQLLEEAVGVEREDGSANASEFTESLVEESSAESLPSNSSHVAPLRPGPAPKSLTSKLTGFIFSYLPSPRSAPPPKPPPAPPQKAPVLPIPPPEVFQKTRAPIKTPAPKPLPKPTHPKELVQLHPAPPRPSKIPRPAAGSGDPGRIPRPVSVASFGVGRRDSGASVKDLIQSFESMEKIQAAERDSLRKLEVRRGNRIQQWNDARGSSKLPKAVWRP